MKDRIYSVGIGMAVALNFIVIFSNLGPYCRKGYEPKIIPIKSIQDGYGILEDGREFKIEERAGKLSLLEKSVEKIK